MDKIAEMLTKIRNAQMAGHKEVAVGHSNFKFSLAEILAKEGFVDFVSKTNNGDEIKIGLKYHKISGTSKIPAIKGIRKVSRLGQRIYIKNKDIKNFKNKYGIAIFSTSAGVMTGQESKSKGLGGEYICEVW